MKKQRGVLVQTDSGEKGVYYPDQDTINGKYPVTMLKENLKPKKDNEGNEVKKLFRSEQLKIVGYLN